MSAAWRPEPSESALAEFAEALKKATGTHGPGDPSRPWAWIEQDSRSALSLWIWSMEMDERERRLFGLFDAHAAHSRIIDAATRAARFDPGPEAAATRRMGRAMLMAGLASGAQAAGSDPLLGQEPWRRGTDAATAFPEACRSIALAKKFIARGKGAAKYGATGVIGAAMANGFMLSPSGSALASYASGPLALAGFSLCCAGFAAGYLSVSRRSPHRAKLFEVVESTYPDLADEGFFATLRRYEYVSSKGDPLSSCQEAIESRPDAQSREGIRLAEDFKSNARFFPADDEPWPARRLAIQVEAWDIERAAEGPAAASSRPKPRL